MASHRDTSARNRHKPCLSGSTTSMDASSSESKREHSSGMTRAAWGWGFIHIRAQPLTGPWHLFLLDFCLWHWPANPALAATTKALSKVTRLSGVVGSLPEVLRKITRKFGLPEAGGMFPSWNAEWFITVKSSELHNPEGASLIQAALAANTMPAAHGKQWLLAGSGNLHSPFPMLHIARRTYT